MLPRVGTQLDFCNLWDALFVSQAPSWSFSQVLVSSCMKPLLNYYVNISMIAQLLVLNHHVS